MTEKNPPKASQARQDLRTSGDLIDLEHVFLTIRERWPSAFALSLLLSGLLAFALLRSVPEYTARSALLLERSGDRVLHSQNVVDQTVDSLDAESEILTQIEQLRSVAFLERLVGSLSAEEIGQLRSPYLSTRKSGPGAKTPEQSDAEWLLDYLKDSVQPQRVGRSMVISIELVHRDPASARDLANRVAQDYIGFLSRRYGERNSAAVTFIDGQVDILRERVSAAEKKLQDFREQNNLVSVEQDGNFAESRVQALSAELTRARLERLAFETRLNQLQGLETPDQKVAALSNELPGLAELQTEMEELLSRRAVLSDRYGVNHPAMVENKSGIDAQSAAIERRIESGLSELRQQRDRLQEHEKKLQGELHAAEREALALSGKLLEFRSLQRDAEVANLTYKQLLARQDETAISSQLDSSNVKVFDEAILPTKPSSPNRTRIVLLAAVLAGIVFVAYPLTADLLDRRIKTWNDIENYLGASFLGEIPRTRRKTDNERGAIVRDESDSETVEYFRSLQNQLVLSAKLKMGSSLIITSTSPGEGKSFVVSNLAHTFAATGWRTLIIDADFRRPSQHKLFGLEVTPGILSRMQGENAQPTAEELSADITNLAPRCDLLRAGGHTRNIGPLLENDRFLHLIKYNQAKYDLIVVDTPPAGLFPDAESFAVAADQLVYVCKHAANDRQQVRQILERLKHGGIRLAGVVLNVMPVGKRLAHHYSDGRIKGSSAFKKYYTAAGD
jgi:capsular exopolysaccharide synthesis family protein